MQRVLPVQVPPPAQRVAPQRLVTCSPSTTCRSTSEAVPGRRGPCTNPAMENSRWRILALELRAVKLSDPRFCVQAASHRSNRLEDEEGNEGIGKDRSGNLMLQPAMGPSEGRIECRSAGVARYVGRKGLQSIRSWLR